MVLGVEVLGAGGVSANGAGHAELGPGQTPPATAST